MDGGGMLLRRNRSPRVYSYKPLIISHPHIHKLEANSLFQNDCHPISQLQFSSMLDTWFSRIKVLRALDQEIEGARQGREGIGGWNFRNEHLFHGRLGTMRLGWRGFSDCSWLPPLLQQSVEWGWRGALQSSGTDAEKEKKNKRHMTIYHSSSATITRC